MKIGALRHRVTIQQLSKSQNGMGEEEPGWTNFATRWASIEPISGREYFSAQQVNAEITHRVKMRHLEGLESTMRILYGARAFEIKSIMNIKEKNQELEILCVERAG
jgi:SPP1 family predicted phage head-tail adaptor